jgi:hypothetical protein
MMGWVLKGKRLSPKNKPGQSLKADVLHRVKALFMGTSKENPILPGL